MSLGISKHLGYNERKIIEKLYKTKKHADIGEVIGCSEACISRELQRCEKGDYNAEQAQKNADELKRNKHRVINETMAKRKAQTIEEKMICIEKDKVKYEQQLLMELEKIMQAEMDPLMRAQEVTKLGMENRMEQKKLATRLRKFQKEIENIQTRLS